MVTQNRAKALLSPKDERFALVFTVCIFILSRKQVTLSKQEAEKDGVVVPITLEDYIVKSKPPESNLELTDFYDDDYDLDEDDELEGDDEIPNSDDSGNGES